MAARAQPAPRHLAIAVVQPNQNMIGINQMLRRNVLGTQYRLHIIDDVQSEALPVSVQHFVLAQRIILIILAVMSRPEDDLIRRELAEAVRADNIVKQRPRLGLWFPFEQIKQAHRSFLLACGAYSGISSKNRPYLRPSVKNSRT
ncbi:hypothetical protein D3C77_588920 [compost metagenome]